jgi:cell division protein FtsX
MRRPSTTFLVLSAIMVLLFVLGLVAIVVLANR